MEPTYMPAKHADADAVMPCRVCGCHHADKDQRLPQSLWATLVGRVDDFIKLVRQVDDQRGQRAVARQPGESTEPQQPGQPHVCPRNPKRSCNCDPGRCADDDTGIRRRDGRVTTLAPSFFGRFRYPLDGEPFSATLGNKWRESRGAGSEADADRRYAEAGKYR